MESASLKRVEIIGVPITATNMKESVEYIATHLDELRGEYICVSNVHTTVMAHDDSSYYDVQTESVMSLPDGKPLSVIGRRAEPKMDRVTGPDLMRELFDAPYLVDRTHYFYGNNQDNLEKLINVLGEEYPKLKIAGFEPSSFRELSELEKEELAASINESGADFAWISIGAPRQEKLCHDLKGKVNALMIGTGGAFNILAGITPEAPTWMKNMGLEWLFRLIQEPTRLFRRYLVSNTKFIVYSLFKVKPKALKAKGVRYGN